VATDPIRERIDAALRQQRVEKATQWEARNPALQSLIDRVEWPEVRSAAEELLGDEDPERRLLGARILRENRDRADELGPLFLEALRAETDDEVFQWLVSAFNSLAYRPALPQLARLTTHPHADVRYSLAGALSTCGWPDPPESALTALRQLAEDKDRDVRFSAMFELGAWRESGHRDPRVEQLLKARAEDPDPRVRRAVAEAMAAI
jgi:HEAT repeat protein